MIIKGFANVYYEVSGKYDFDYSIFVYPNEISAKISNKNLGDSDCVALAIPIKIKIPDKNEGRKK